MSLSDAYLKTTRAKKHLDDLLKELAAFHESKPYEFQEKLDFENQRYRIRIKVKDPPEELSLIAGDIFCCLRASLDYLVWALATLNTSSYAEHTQFPILEKEDAPRFEKQTKGVPAEAATIIESLQPYRAGDTQAIHRHLLWRLNKLCNIDKHRRIPVYGSTVDFKLPHSIAPFVMLEDDGVMSFPLKLKQEVKIGCDPNNAFKVVFGDSYDGIECDKDGIKQIYEFVAENVIPRFSRFSTTAR